MVFNVAKLGRCHKDGIFMVFNVAKLGRCHNVGILLVFNVAKLGRCHNVGILLVFNVVAKLGWCDKDSILMLVLTSQGINGMRIYVGLVLS
jgi:hypothetical protein